MKFTAPSKLLYNQVSAVSRVIGSKNAMAVLNNFLFTLSGNELIITASDIENTLTAKLAVNNAGNDGKFCVDAKKIVDLLKELPDQGITFDVNDTNYSIKITSLNGDFNLIGLDGDQYPQNENEVKDSDKLRFVVPTSQILAGLNNTLFAAGTDELWPQMMGVYWDVTDDGITFVATDSRKLVKYEDHTGKPGVTGSFILPSKPAAILKNLLQKADGEIEIETNAVSGNFTIDDFVLNCRFVKGNFPDYNRVIPKTNPYILTVDRQQFLNAVKRVAVFVEGHGMIRFQIEPETVILQSQDIALCTSGLEKVPCTFNGSKMIIGFSAPLLIDICATIQSEELEIRLADPSRPGLFLPSENPEGTDLLMLLMPMNVGDF